MAERRPKFYIDVGRLPENYPTQMHDPGFWESLGRVVATFGYLEHVLKAAILILTGTRDGPEKEKEAEARAAVEEWLASMEATATGTLNPLIKRFGTALQEHPASECSEEFVNDLVQDLLRAASIRNALCHAAWITAPGCDGATKPVFVNRQLMAFESRVDRAWLDQVRQSVAELSAHIVNSVMQMGYQFPGFKNGPGERIF